MGIAVYLKDIGSGSAITQALSRGDAHALMREVLEGRTSAAESGAFVMAMRLRGTTLDELSGFLGAAQTHCLQVRSHEPVVVDNLVYGHRAAVAPAIRFHNVNLGHPAARSPCPT